MTAKAGVGHAVVPEACDQRLVVVGCGEPETVRVRVGILPGLGRQDARPRVRRPTRVAPVHQHGGGSGRDQLVGERCSDQPASDHHDVGTRRLWCHHRIIADSRRPTHTASRPVVARSRVGKVGGREAPTRPEPRPLPTRPPARICPDPPENPTPTADRSELSGVEGEMAPTGSNLER